MSTCGSSISISWIHCILPSSPPFLLCILHILSFKLPPNTLILLVCRLTEYGFSKLINELDMKEAARQGLLGLGSKPARL